MTGTVFDIKEFTLHDGPGSRVTVFLKGCPLRCMWCHNPEGLSVEPQITVKENLCRHCNLCKKPCNHKECEPFGRCIHACPGGFLEVAGKTYTSNQLAEKIRSYKPFFENCGGGVTFSGGEPLLQADFVAETEALLPDIHKTLQTSGFASKQSFEKVLNNTDYVLMDIKLANSDAHKKYTGQSNEPILNNFKILKQSGKPFAVRVPLIPNITDTPENLKGIAEIVGDSPVEVMRYNPFAGAKYKNVGLEFKLPKAEPQTDVDLSMFENARIV